MKRTLFTCFSLLLTLLSAAQTTWNFSTPASLTGSPWLNYATVTIGGVSYRIGGGINGSYSNVTTGGNGNSAALKKTASGGDMFTIQRTDGKRFQFYGLWMKQSSMNGYPGTPPFYTIRFFNGSTEVKGYSVSNASSTITYAENLAVTSVSVFFPNIQNYSREAPSVGAALLATDANLSALSLSKGTLSPAFGANTTGYTASVGFSNSTINVTPTASDNIGATIKINGATVASGSAYSVPLNLGNNTITIEVTAEDGTTKKTYTVVVNRSSSPEYCQPASDCSYGDDVSSFTLAAEENTSVNDPQMACPATGYTDRTSIPAAKLYVGKSYASTLTTNGEQYTTTDGIHFKIWIDFNDDFIFQSSEMVYNSASLYLKNQTASFNISIPANADMGIHRLRIRAVYEDGYNTVPLDACNDADFGETQDYNVNITTAGGTLPLQLLSYKATPANNYIVLNWSTAQEVNLDRFEIERSSNGSVFTKAGVVVAKGDGQYQWIDVAPMEGMNYYRLKMFDKNGESRYSEVSNVKWGLKATHIRIVPNPVTNKTLVMHSSNMPAGVYNAVLFSADGQQVLATQLKLDGASVNQILLPSHINAGVFTLHITGMQQNFKLPVVVR